jgi:hypothetical protein
MRWFLLIYEYDSLVCANVVDSVEEHLSKYDAEQRIEDLTQEWLNSSRSQWTFSISNNESVIDVYKDVYYDLREFNYDIGII